MSRLYSLKQIRKILDSQGLHIPDGTLRNYRDDFLDLLPHEGQGRFVRYHEDALGIFKDIRRFRNDLRLDNEEIRARLLHRLNHRQDQEQADPDDQDLGATQKSAAGTAPATNSPHQHPAAPAHELVARASKTEELAGNIDLRTRYLLDSNTKILSVLQKKYSEDDRNIQSLREDLFGAVEVLKQDQAYLAEEIGEIKYLLKQVLSTVTENASWRDKQHTALEDVPVEEIGNSFSTDQKQRSFFDKLMKF